MSYDRFGRRVTKNAQHFIYNGYLQITIVISKILFLAFFGSQKSSHTTTKFFGTIRTEPLDGLLITR